MAQFNHYRFAPWFFIVPQLLITLIFFIWPAAVALQQAFFYIHPLGLYKLFAGFDNFYDLFRDKAYLQSVWVTLVIAFSVTAITMILGVLMAALVYQRRRSQGLYKALLIWPYAVAPAVAAMLWRFLCHPTLGWLTELLHSMHIPFDYISNAHQALGVIIITASWQQFSYNFLFYFVALQGIPPMIIDAAVMDSPKSWHRFWYVVLPLLSPTSFFLLMMNIIYGFFETFGIVQVLTQGGPGNSTKNLIYKVYEDGFIGMDLGSSAAQSIVLMSLVVIFSLLQVKYLEKKVHYE